MLTKPLRSEEHTSELQSHSEISYAVFCLKKKKTNYQNGYTAAFMARLKDEESILYSTFVVGSCYFTTRSLVVVQDRLTVGFGATHGFEWPATRKSSVSADSNDTDLGI